MADNMADNTLQHATISTKMVEYFTKQMGELLNQLSETFDECGNTKQILEIFNTTVKSHPENQQHMIKCWHATMNPYYMAMIRNPLNEFERVLRELTEKRPSEKTLSSVMSDMIYYKISGNTDEVHKLQEILFDPSYLLSEMHMLEKWHDRDLDADSRAYLVCYIVHLNGFATCNDLIQNKIKIPVVYEHCLPEMLTNFEELDQISTRWAPLLLPQIINHIQDLYVIVCSLYGAGLVGGNLVYHMIDQMVPEQVKAGLPLKSMLETCMKQLLSLKTEDINGLAERIRENTTYKEMMAGETSLLSHLDPQSLMMLQLAITQLTGGNVAGGNVAGGNVAGGNVAGASAVPTSQLFNMLAAIQQQPQ
jgi:hypothetical protein